MFYNLASIHFGIDSPNDLKEFARFSEDGKKYGFVHIGLAFLFCDKGFPFGYEVFNQHSFECSTLIPTIKKLKEKYGINDVTIIVNKAMLSDDNIAALRRAQNFKSDGLKYEEIQLDEDIRLITTLVNSKKYKDQQEPESTVELNGKKKKSRQLNGYFGFITNTDLSPEEMVRRYKEFLEVEKNFEKSRNSLQFSTDHSQNDSRIKAHFAICYLALAVIRHIEFIMKKENVYMPLKKLNEYLTRICEIEIELNGVKTKTATPIPNEIAPIFKALKLKSPQEYLRLRGD